MTAPARHLLPSTPGEFIRHSVLPEDLSVADAARHLGVSRQSLYALLNDQRGLTPDMAQRFELAFGVAASLLLNHQARYDAWQARHRAPALAESVTPFVWPDA